MTAVAAREVNGHAVVNDEPTPSQAVQGKHLVATRTLTLDDGTVIYGCEYCSYTTENVRAVYPHLRACKRYKAQDRPLRFVEASAAESATRQAPAPRPDTPKPAPPPLPDQLIDQVVDTFTAARRAVSERAEAIAERDKAKAERDEWAELAAAAERNQTTWRQRAEKAEAALRKLFEALGVSP